MEEIQKKVKKFSTENGFDSETIEQKLLLLIEEVGELAKAIRKSVGMKTGSHSKDRNIPDEMADVLYVFTDISNKLNIDLEKSLKNKLKKFKKRTYK